MSKKSNDVCPVDAELIYEIPDKRRKTRSRKAAGPEIDICAEVERIFSSRYKLVCQVEDELRKLQREILIISTPTMKKVLEQTKGKHCVSVTGEGITTPALYPLSVLANSATQLRIEFCRLDYMYRELFAWTNDCEGSRNE